jgi:hypothetical protein
MKPFASRIVADSSGHSLHCYEPKQSDAERYIFVIHRTPATAAVFGERFRRPFPRANLAALDRPGFGAPGPDRQTEDDESAISAARNRVNTYAPNLRNTSICIGREKINPYRFLKLRRKHEN